MRREFPQKKSAVTFQLRLFTVRPLGFVDAAGRNLD